MTSLIEESKMTSEILAASLTALAAEIDSISKEDRRLGFAADTCEAELNVSGRVEMPPRITAAISHYIRSF